MESSTEKKLLLKQQKLNEKKQKFDAIVKRITEESFCSSDVYFGSVIQNHRKGKGFTQEELGLMCQVSQPLIAQWEKGELKPDVKQLLTLCYCFDITPSEFFNQVFEENELLKKWEDSLIKQRMKKEESMMLEASY